MQILSSFDKAKNTGNDGSVKMKNSLPDKETPGAAMSEAAKSQLERLRAVAAAHGGKCVSAEYVTLRGVMDFWCAQHGNFSTRALNIIDGDWCRKCKKEDVNSRTSGAIRRLKEYIAEHGGKLKSAYVDAATPVLVECAVHGEWLVSPSGMVAKKSWCKKCASLKAMVPKTTCWVTPEKAAARLAVMQERAALRGGECLATVYVDGGTPMEFHCPQHGVFSAKPRNILKGNWCSECARLRKVPGMVKRLQEYIAAHGGTLKSEYVGNATPVLVGCALHGDFWAKPVSLLKSNNWCPICDELKMGWVRGEETGQEAVSGKRKKFFLTPALREELLQRLHDIAAGHGGKCLSTHYVGTLAKMDFWCHAHGAFSARTQNVVQGSWCKKCYLESTYGGAVKRLSDYIARHGGKLKSEYVDSSTPVLIECPIHGQWLANPARLLSQESWCRECVILTLKGRGVPRPFNKRITPDWSERRLKEMQEYAAQRGGECLSTTYTDCRMDMEFRCAQHGKFWSKPTNIQKGNWCQQCAWELQKPTMVAKLQAYITARNGTLKSEYVNVHTRIMVECADHGEWRTTPNQLLYEGSWCPLCREKPAGLRKRKKSKMRVPMLL